MTLYLIDKTDTIYRIPMDAALQAEVKLLLQNQYMDFIKDVEFTDFQGSYRAQPGELNKIQDYQLTEEITFAMENAGNLPILDLNAAIVPKALMAKIDVAEEDVIVFQKVDDRILTLGKKIDAAFTEDRLIFYSFSQIRSFLPVLEHYEEATKVDVDLFIEVEEFAFEDEVKFRKGLSPLTRKKIKMIQDNQVLELSSVGKIKKQSKKYGVKIKYNEQGQVIFPKSIAKCKEIISFLNEEFATAVLTKRKIRMNSKKYL